MPRVLHIIGPSKGYGYPIFESENPWKGFLRLGELLSPHLGIKCPLIPIAGELSSNPLVTNIPILLVKEDNPTCFTQEKSLVAFHSSM
jgi:hypothetical protein